MRATFSELAAAVGRCERCTLDYSAHPHRDCPMTYAQPYAPNCGHSVCSQHFIDTGSTDCVGAADVDDAPVLECETCGREYPIDTPPERDCDGETPRPICDCGGTLWEAQ